MTASIPSNICLNPLHEALSSASLKTLSSIVSTCLGPHGKLKLLQNVSGGCSAVTSSSRRLLERLSVKRVVSKIVCSAALSQLKSFNDNGLLCALLTLNLVNSAPLKYPFPTMGVLFGYLGKMYIDCLQSESSLCTFDVNFSNLTHLRCLVDSVLSSKPGCALTSSVRIHLRNLLLKAFLNVFPSSALDDGNVRLFFSGGMSSGRSRLYDGLLVKGPETDFGIGNCSGPFKTVLFTVSLVGEVPSQVVEGASPCVVLEAILKSAESVIEKVIADGVQIVFCQKVIHPRLKKQLQNAKVFVLERLGSETAKYVQYISGGSSNSSLFSEVKYGSIYHVQKQIVGQDHYLLLRNDNNVLFSLVLCNYSEEAGQEMMVVCRQAIDMLFRVLRSSRVCFGAGCTEIYSAHLLAKEVHENAIAIEEEMECSPGEVQVALRSFLRSIATTCVAVHQGSLLDFATETTYGHLWKWGEDRCMCECVSAGDIRENSWTHLSDMDGSSLTAKITSAWTTVVLDELSCKVGSSLRAIETSTLLLQTAFVVNNAPQDK